MSVNIIPFFRSSYFVGDQPEFVDPELFDLYQINQDQDLSNLSRRNLFVEPLTEEVVRCSFAYGPNPNFSKSVFMSENR